MYAFACVCNGQLECNVTIACNLFSSKTLFNRVINKSCNELRKCSNLYARNGKSQCTVCLFEVRTENTQSST